jgi:hypothetical protein
MAKSRFKDGLNPKAASWRRYCWIQWFAATRFIGMLEGAEIRSLRELLVPTIRLGQCLPLGNILRSL